MLSDNRLCGTFVYGPSIKNGVSIILKFDCQNIVEVIGNDNEGDTKVLCKVILNDNEMELRDKSSGKRIMRANYKFEDNNNVLKYYGLKFERLF